jgi:monofunctional biosynthetic peptidoglycan transglycosylase
LRIFLSTYRGVIASEDGSFLIHNGFDFKAMQKAYKGNERGRKIKGSTISQQTAKKYFYGRVVVTLGKD